MDDARRVRSGRDSFRCGFAAGGGVCHAERIVKNMAATDTDVKIPEFENEAHEARWRDEHKDLVEENLIEAMRDGAAQRGSAQRLVKEARASKNITMSKNITIRMPLADLERARQLSARKGLAYQTFINKMLLHEALDREEKRPVA
jgi:predicted DNA binding CopG/RHH family protein